MDQRNAPTATDEEMAFHEAGHAIVHLLDGGTISRVSIDREDPRAGTSPGPRDLDPPADEASARRRAAVALAGEAAGVIHNERRLRAVAQPDYDAAERALQHLGGDASSVRRIIAEEAASVRERLMRPEVWRKVETIAEALLRQRVVGGDTVNHLFGSE